MTPDILSMKEQAKRLRTMLAEDGGAVSHSRALEMVARQYGYSDWNTAHALAGNRQNAAPVQVGEVVRGHYLGQPFSASVKGVQAGAGDRRWRVTLELDEPVDVVRFESFSAYRRRITATVDASGVTAEKTSDGTPHLVLDI